MLSGPRVSDQRSLPLSNCGGHCGIRMMGWSDFQNQSLKSSVPENCRFKVNGG